MLAPRLEPLLGVALMHLGLEACAVGTLACTCAQSIYYCIPLLVSWA